MLDKFGIFGAVVRVEPLVRRQNELHEAVGNVGLNQLGMVHRVDRQIGDYLQCQAYQLLKNKKTKIKKNKNALTRETAEVQADI